MAHKEDYVDRKLALELKKLGFGYPCIFYFKKTPEDLIKKEGKYIMKCDGNPMGHFTEGKNYNQYSNITSAPLYTQAFKWFRIKHNLDKESLTFKDNWYFIISRFFGDEDSDDLILDYFDDYNKARRDCLINMIDIVKGKITI